MRSDKIKAGPLIPKGQTTRRRACSAGEPVYGRREVQKIAARHCGRRVAADLLDLPQAVFYRVQMYEKPPRGLGHVGGAVEEIRRESAHELGVCALEAGGELQVLLEILPRAGDLVADTREAYLLEREDAPSRVELSRCFPVRHAVHIGLMRLCTVGQIVAADYLIFLRDFPQPLAAVRARLECRRDAPRREGDERVLVIAD